MFWVFLAVALAVVLLLAPRRMADGKPSPIPQVAVFGVQVLLVLFVLFSIASTSYVIISPDEVGHLSRIYWAKSLPGGRIIALDGEKGPQAEILSAGFHFRLLLNVLYKVEKQPIVDIKAGKYGKLVARDGKPLRPGQAFADVFGGIDEMLDATTFLTKGGQKGPQIIVLTPGKYRINHYLWDVSQDEDTDIPKGFVGVLKSNVHAAVNFGDMTAEKPKECIPTKETDLSGGKLAVPLVPVGCIGIWDRPLLPGRYYLNKDVYTIIPMDTRVQTWEFKGGFKRRTVALMVDQQGKISQKETETDEAFKPDEYADRAVFLKVEGWDVPQELRVLVQITPENAPIVVASVGDEKEVEHRIIIPAVRSIVRDVTGGGFIDTEEMNDKGEIVKVKRAPRVLDLLNNRSVLEQKVLHTMRPEGQKAGVEIKEVRFGDPAVPPELLVARLREQLAQQLSSSYRQEKNAQDDRISTENARATADQQGMLVQAQIELERQKKLKEAAELAGQGEKLKLTAISDGQKAQAAVLGQERVVELRKYELLIDRVFDVLDKHPDLVAAALANASKFVPNTVIQTDGKGGSLEGAASIFGTLLKSGEGTPPRERKE